MSESLGFSRWRRPSKGARVIRGARLLDGTAADVVLRIEDRDVMFDPSEEPGLLDDLVRLRIEPEPVAAFVSRWGLLGVGEVVTSVSARAGERLDVWRAAVGRLRDAFELWASVEAADREELRERLVIGPGNATYTAGSAETYSFPTIAPMGKRRSVKEDLLPFLERGDVVEVGRLLVQVLVNTALQDLVTMQLVAPVENADARPDKWRVRTLTLKQLPKSLLGLAWLRLAEAASGDRIPRRCPRCKSWFMIAAATRRGHGIYCSPKCRIAFHAKRQQARALTAEGVRVPTIAARLQVSTGIIRGWIGEPKTRRTARRRKGA